MSGQETPAATLVGRAHIANIAELNGEYQFAREVRAGAWDHRRDVAAAIARAAIASAQASPSSEGAKHG